MSSSSKLCLVAVVIAKLELHTTVLCGTVVQLSSEIGGDYEVFVGNSVCFSTIRLLANT